MYGHTLIRNSRKPRSLWQDLKGLKFESILKSIEMNFEGTVIIQILKYTAPTPDFEIYLGNWTWKHASKPSPPYSIVNALPDRVRSCHLKRLLGVNVKETFWELSSIQMKTECHAHHYLTAKNISSNFLILSQHNENLSTHSNPVLSTNPTIWYWNPTVSLSISARCVVYFIQIYPTCLQSAMCVSFYKCK